MEGYNGNDKLIPSPALKIAKADTHTFLVTRLKILNNFIKYLDLCNFICVIICLILVLISSKNFWQTALTEIIWKVKIVLNS